MEKIINFYVTEQAITCDTYELVSNTKDVYVAKFNFDVAWDGYVKKGVFNKNGTDYQMLLDDDNKCLIPFEFVEDSGYGCVGAYGFGSNQTYPTIYTKDISIFKGCTDGETPQPPSPDIYQELLEAYAEAMLKINGEILRATNKEIELNSSIETNELAIYEEVNRATTSETQIESNLENEILRATNKEATLESGLADEVTARSATDNELRTGLNSEIQRATNKEATLESGLADEVTARSATDNELRTGLNSEIQRATNKENSIESALNTEKSRAINVETSLNDLIVANKTELEESIATEASTARTAEQTNATAIANEKARSQSAESTLTDNLSAEVSRATTAEDEINTSLSNHKEDKDNPHEVTKAQVGLGNVDNTSDVNKPLSVATQTELNNKVDKVNGKSLIDDTEITRLANVHNYDDSGLSGRVTAIENQESTWNGKQDAIEDLETIRSGASLGATSLQSIPTDYKTKTQNDELYQPKGDVPTKTSELTNDSGFLTEHQSLSGYATESWVEAKGYVDNTYHDLTKQDTINDLDTIRAGASLGATSIQQHQDISGKVDKIDGYSLMSDVEHTKLQEVEEGANNFVLPSDVVQDASYIHTDNNLTNTLKTKLEGISTNAKKVESSTTNGNIKIDGTETTVYDDTQLKSDISLLKALGLKVIEGYICQE